METGNDETETPPSGKGGRVTSPPPPVSGLDDSEVAEVAKLRKRREQRNQSRLTLANATDRETTGEWGRESSSGIDGTN